ncbi:MAG: TctA family transporter [Paraglaciecola sp.]|jgi:TctA family transporter
MGGIGTFAILLLFFLIWVLPIILILSSSKTRGGEKLAWLLLVVFVSWFAGIFYLLLAPISNKEAQS